MAFLKQYLYIALILSLIAIWAATGIGCIPSKVIKKDCWDVAVERCLPCIRAGYDCEIWLGSLSNTPFHAESCVIIEEERVWLRGGGLYRVVIDHNYTPQFVPLYSFPFFQFVESMYGEE